MKTSSLVFAIALISAPLPALATHNLQPRPQLTEQQKADEIISECLMWALHPDMSYAGLEWNATYCDGHQFEKSKNIPNDSTLNTANESCKGIIVRPTHLTTGPRTYIVPNGSIQYFDGANNKTVVCEHGGSCYPRSAVRWLTPCPYDGHWPYGAGE